MTPQPADRSEDVAEGEALDSTVIELSSASGRTATRQSRSTRTQSRNRAPSGKNSKVRMTGQERREQLLDVGRTLFADKGFEAVSVEEIAARSEYMISTFSVLKVLTGLDFELVRSGPEKNSLTTACYQDNTLFYDAGSFPTDDGWIGRLASSVPKVMSEQFKCNQSATDDVLIYNRQGSRRIVNDRDVARVLQGKGLTTKIITPNELSPMEQICEMTKNRKLIITPHGGHQGTFLFKCEGVAVVVVSPNSALLECYRFFARRSDPWYSIRAERTWSCPDVCSISEDAFSTRAATMGAYASGSLVAKS